MLGKSKVPPRHINASARLKWSAPPLVEDDKILLHLQIPPSIGLTTRKIVAQLASFRASDHPMFFDPVYITFPVDYSPPYKFITDSMVESACKAQVHENKFRDLELYQGKHRSCQFLRLILEHWTLEGIPNWQCKGPVEYCNRVGPFSNQGVFSNSGIFIQRFECFQSSAQPDYNISAAISIVPAVEHNTRSSGLGSVREKQNTVDPSNMEKSIPCPTPSPVDTEDALNKANLQGKVPKSSAHDEGHLTNPSTQKGGVCTCCLDTHSPLDLHTHPYVSHEHRIHTTPPDAHFPLSSEQGMTFNDFKNDQAKYMAPPITRAEAALLVAEIASHKGDKSEISSPEDDDNSFSFHYKFEDCGLSQYNFSKRKFESNEEQTGNEVVYVYVAADRDKVVIKILKSYWEENQIDRTSYMKCFERVLGISPKDWLVVPFEHSAVREDLFNSYSYKSGLFSASSSFVYI
ncbi:hypothetical protein SUGI_0366690 [Cryptomeria japonica]|nr:hypothetical protein SUGI_0366640 [Cryptomeria japonica]GLJ20202.1 hypothetical protein SUGI_0366690 [Cryptomeria japonica]